MFSWEISNLCDFFNFRIRKSPISFYFRKFRRGSPRFRLIVFQRCEVWFRSWTWLNWVFPFFLLDSNLVTVMNYWVSLNEYGRHCQISFRTKIILYFLGVRLSHVHCQSQWIVCGSYNNSWLLLLSKKWKKKKISENVFTINFTSNLIWRCSIWFYRRISFRKFMNDLYWYFWTHPITFLKFLKIINFSLFYRVEIKKNVKILKSDGGGPKIPA